MAFVSNASSALETDAQGAAQHAAEEDKDAPEATIPAPFMM